MGAVTRAIPPARVERSALPAARPSCTAARAGRDGRLAEEAVERRPGRLPAGDRPRRELSHIHPPVPHFAIVNPTLRLAERLPQLPLGQPRPLAERPQECRERFVGRGVLRLGRHPERG